MKTLKSYCLSLFALITLLLVMSSCGGGGKTSAPTTSVECDSTKEENSSNSVIAEDTTANSEGTAEADGTQEESRVYFTIPAPEEVLSYVTEGGLAFNPALMNPISNQPKYVDSRSKSINLGVFFSDVAYTAVFSQPARSAEYLKVIEEFGVEISVFSNADKQMRVRMTNNMNNVDSVSNISKEAYEVIVDYLFNSNRQKTYALLCIGAYVESMYLVLNYADNFNDFSAPMMRKIIEQKLLFDDIYRIMLSQKGDPDIDLTLKEIQPIKESLDKIGFAVSNPTSGENKQGDLLIKSDNKYEYTEGSFTKFRNQIVTLRNNWTGN